MGQNWTQIKITTKEFSDWSSDFTIASDGIKVTKAGLYRVSASVYFSGHSNATRLGAGILKGSSFSGASEKCATLFYIGGTSAATIITTGPKLISLNANDIVFLAGRAVSGSATINSSTTHTYLLIERVR